MRDLQNKSVLITGAASGTGRETAIAFAREGAGLLVLNDIDLKGLRETAGLLEGSGCEIVIAGGDVANYRSVAAMMDKILDEHGCVDVLVNAAGISKKAPIEDLEPGDFKEVLGVNLMGMVNTVHSLYPCMVDRGSGHIVNVASVGGLVVNRPYIAPWFTSEFAAVGFSEALMLEGCTHGIGVTCFCKGAAEEQACGATPARGSCQKVKGLVKNVLSIDEKPGKAARKIVESVKASRFLVLPTPAARLRYWAHRHFQVPWFSPPGAGGRLLLGILGLRKTAGHGS